MVRSKEVPKKPKDPLLTPPSKPRRSSLRDDGGFGGSLPRNRGGAAMSSPAPASVPNYMRATNSSGAKSGQRASASASTPTRQRRPVRLTPRGKVLFPAPAASASPGMARPTCSSTLKDAKFPGALDLAPGATDAEGPAATRVCPYTYCSLNGHAHAPAVPLRSFLAARRRLIKTQQSMKHRGVSAFRAGHRRPEGNKSAVSPVAVAKAAPPLVGGDALLGDFFVEVYTGPRVSSGTSCSDMSLDEVDATVRRMEFVVFDRCGADDGNGKGGDLAVRGDGEAGPGVCGDSSSECSDAGISGSLVEELPWMRYQGDECDSLDDDVSEEQVVIREVTGEAEVLAQEQEGGDEAGKSGGLGDEREEEADEEQKPEDLEEIIPDLHFQTEIVAEEEGVNCRVDIMFQQETSTRQETQHPGDDDECVSSVSDVVDKMEIAAEQACTVCLVEVCKEEEERDDDKSEEKLFDSVCETEIIEYEVAEMAGNVLKDSCKEENSTDQEAKDDKINIDSACRFEITQKQKDGESETELEISETVPDVACDEDFCEQEATSGAVSEGESSESSSIASPDVEISNHPTDGGFEQDVNTIEDAVEQLDTTAENTVSGTEDAQQGLEITACKSEDASEESGITQESSQDFNSVFVDAPVKIEPEITEHKPEDSSEDYGIPQESSHAQIEVCDDAPAHMEPEITERKPEDSSEESGIPQESSHAQIEVCDDAPAQMEPEITERKPEDSSEKSGIPQESSHAQIEVCDDAPAQMEPEITERKPENSSEEIGIPQESSQSDMSAHVNNGALKEVCVDTPAQMEREITEYKMDDSFEEAGIPQESSKSANCVHVNNGADTEPEFNTCNSDDPSEECGTTQEIIHDDNSAYLGEADSSADISDDGQNDSEITKCELDEASESLTVQEADQDYNCEDLCGGAHNESALITSSELANASEGCDVTQEAVRDDNTEDVNDDPKKEPETMACESAHGHEELDISQEGDEDDYAAGALKETQTCETKDASEEVCITEEANLLSIAQLPEHNYDLSTSDSHEEPLDLPAQDSDTKDFSVDDMCNVFSGMNLKGDVYVDPTESDISPRKRLIIAGRRRTPEEEEHLRGFNPRAPNFLPLELDPDSEKVDLKHQTAEDRKNAEEWMIDYALRRAVNNLGGRKKKVELLVQAFETVLPHDEEDKKNITPTRAVQPCN